MGPLRKFGWLLWRLGATGCVLLWAVGGGPVQALLAWLVLGYLVVRAWPAVSGDLVRVRSLLTRRGGRYSARSGEL